MKNRKRKGSSRPKFISNCIKILRTKKASLKMQKFQIGFLKTKYFSFSPSSSLPILNNLFQNLRWASVCTGKEAMAAQIGVSQSEPGEKGIHMVIEGLSLLRCRNPRIVRRASMWQQPITGCQVPNVVRRVLRTQRSNVAWGIRA